MKIEKLDVDMRCKVMQGRCHFAVIVVMEHSIPNTQKNFGFEHLYRIKCLLFRLFWSSNSFIEQLFNPRLSRSLYNYCYFEIWNCKSAFQIALLMCYSFYLLFSLFFLQTIEEYSIIVYWNRNALMLIASYSIKSVNGSFIHLN